jgi:hypothetical protein
MLVSQHVRLIAGMCHRRAVSSATVTPNQCRCRPPGWPNATLKSLAAEHPVQCSGQPQMERGFVIPIRPGIWLNSPRADLSPRSGALDLPGQFLSARRISCRIRSLVSPPPSGLAFALSR